MRTRQPATVRVARWSATHPWQAIGMWVLFVGACLAAISVTGLRQATDLELGIGESGRADEIVHAGDIHDPAVENVLITARSGALDQELAGQVAAHVAERMERLGEVDSVGDPVPSADGAALLVPVTMSGDPLTSDERVEPLLEATAAVQADHPDLRVEQAGGASANRGINEQVNRDLEKAFLVSVPLTLVILLVAFGAVIAAGVPVLLAVTAVAAAVGLQGPVTQVVPGAETTLHVIVLIGMAVGVDYSLFYLRREREERSRGRGHADAVEIAAATAGHSVVVSGAAVMVAVAGLFVARDVTFSSMATGGILVVAVAVLGSLTVLPALLAKLGRWVDRPRVPFLWRLSMRGPDGHGGGQPRLWSALLRPALRHPAVTLVLSVAAMLALAAPALDLTLRTSSIDAMPRSIPVVDTSVRLFEKFPSVGSGHVVAAQVPAGRTAELRAALEDLAGRTQADPLFARDQPPEIQLSDDGTVGILNVATPYDWHTPEALDSLDRLREEYVPDTVGAIDGAEYAVGGQVAGSDDYRANMVEALPLVLGFVLALTMVMMAVTFRSVVVGLTAIVVNLLSTLAAFGLLVLVFQNTWAEDLLGFTATGSVTTWVPMFLFVILFGLSMDYHVLVVSRIREAAGRGLPIREAVAEGVTRSAGTVTSAAVVMVGVFCIFATLTLVEMKQLGVGLSVAVLLDAVLVRTVLLPSAMTLLGRANWWPSRLSRTPGRHEPPAVEPEPYELERQPT